MSRAAIDPAAVEARVRQRIAERGLSPEQVEAVFSKIRPKLEASGLLPPMAPLPTMPGTDNWLARRFGLAPVQITPAKIAELNAAASTMMPRGPGLDADPLAAKYAASGGAYTESGGVIPQYRRGPSGDIVPPPRQIQPMDYGPEILAASRSVTPAEISAMRELAVVEGGSLDGQPDELVAVLAAARKMGRNNTMTSAGPEVMPPAPPPTSPVGRFMDATAAGRGVRDFAQGVGSGAIVQPGAAITSTIGAGFDLARMSDTGRNFADAATLMQQQAPQSDSLAFQGGQIVGNVLPAAAVPFTGGGAMPLVMTLMGTQGFGSGVQEYRAAKQAQGKPIDPEEQALVGLAFAAIEIGTEKIGIDSVFEAVPAARGAIGRFSQSPTKAAAREVLDVLGPVVATNAGEEAASQLGQNAVAKGVYDPNRNLAEGVGAAALGGAFGGLVMGAPAAASSGLNAGFAARMQAEQSRTRTDAGGQGTTTPDTAPVSPDATERQRTQRDGEAPAPQPVVTPTMPQDAADPATDPEVVDPTDAAAVARVDGLLAILEDESRVGTPEYEAARAELDSIGADVVAAEPPVSPVEPPVSPTPMRRVDRPARPMPPTVSLNPSEIPNGSATVGTVPNTAGPFGSAPRSGSARFADRLGPFPRVTEGQRQTPAGETADSTAVNLTAASRPESDQATRPSAGPEVQQQSNRNALSNRFSDQPTATGYEPQDFPQGRQSGTSGSPQPVRGQSPSPKSTREPWQMTRGEYAQSMYEAAKAKGGFVDGMGRMNSPERVREWADRQHGGIVEYAAKSGKPVPPEVLAEYPDLSPDVRKMGAAPQNQARSEGSTGESVTLPDRGGRVIEPPVGAPTGGNGTETAPPVNPDEMSGVKMRKYLASIGVDNRGDVPTLRNRIKQVQRGEAPTPYTPAGPAPTGWEVSDNLKKSVEHAKARPGWRLEHLSDSGSAYLVHEASGKMVRVSDHAVPQTREREMFGGTPPWAGNEAINHRTGDARREFDRIAKEIEDNHAESMAEANPPAKPDSSSEQKGTVTVKDGTAKDVGARRIEEARTLYGGMRRIAGWIFADDPATPALIHPTEDRVVLFSPKAGSGSSLLEARTRAQAFAQENPVASKPSTSPPGEMVVKDLRVQPQPGGSVPAATNQERANGEEAPQAERLLNAGTAAPAESSAPQGTGAVVATEPTTITERLDRFISERQAAIDTRMGKGPGGIKYLGSGPPIDVVVNIAAIAAARVVKAGVNGYAAVRRIINDTIAQHPEATKRAREIGRQALAIIRESRNPDKSYNLDKFEAAVGARQAKQTTTAETRAAVKETDGTAKDVPTVTEAEALKARYKAERKAANAADRAARGEEREKAKMDRRQRAERSRFELGQLRDTLKAAASNQKRASDLLNTMLQRTADDLERQLTKAQIADGLREQLVKTIQDTLPAAVRGKLLTDVRDVATLSGMARAMTKARKELARYEGRAAYVDVKRNTKKRVLLGLTEDRRATIDGLIQTVGAARQQLLDAKTVDQMEAAAAALRQAADDIMTQIAEHRAENTVIRGQFRADVGEWIRKVTTRLKTRHGLRPRNERGEVQERPWTERAVMTMLDGEAFAMKLDDHFTDDTSDDVTPIRRLLYDDLTAAQNRKFQIIEKAIGELDALAKKAGYANMHDALRVLGDDVLGEASTQYVDVKVGQRTSIPLGMAIKIYALDPETRFKAINGRRFNWVDDPTGAGFQLTPGVMAAVQRALPIELRRFVDAAKGVRDGLRTELFAAHRELKGFEPVAVEKYEPTRTNPWKQEDDVDLSDAAAVAGWLDNFDVRSWENSGFLKGRVDNAKAPLLLTNWANDLVRSIDGAASVIALAPAVRNARTVLGSQPVTEVLSERFGKGAVQRVAELVAIASGANMGPSHSLGRALEWLTRNVSRSLTQFSEQSHLKQLGGLFKIAAEMPASTVVRGLGGMFAADTRGEMMRDTAYLRARSSLPSQALFTQLGASGAMPTAGSARAAGRAVAASARQAGRRLLTLEWGKAGGDVADIIGRSAPALLDSISVAQWFDQMPARLAWAGFTAQAKAEGKGPAWVAEQTERAMRRSANPSNAMDQSGFAIAMRRSGLGFMIAFTGDPYKSFAQLYRANKVGGAYRAKVYAGVLGNVLWSAMVTVALKKGMEALGRLIAGGDDDDEKKWLTDAAERAGWLAAKDLAGIVPLGNAVAGAVEMLVKGKQQQGSVIDTPVGGALDRALRGVNQGFRGLRAAFEKRTDAEQARMVDDLLGGLWQSGVALGSLLGLPLPVVDRVQRNVRAGTKEVPRADELQKYRESKGEPTREDAKEITRARRRMVDGLLETDPERVADAMTDLERLGAKPKYRQIVDAMENAYPLAGVPKRERQKALLSLSPKRRAEVKREIDRWQRARERMYETVSRAKRSMATK